MIFLKMEIQILLLEPEICCDWGHSLAIHAKFMLEKNVPVVYILLQNIQKKKHLL